MEAVLLAIAMLFILYFILKDRRVRFPQFFRKSFPSKTPNSSPLEQRLLRLVHGDKNAARRLIEQAKRKNPGRAADKIHQKIVV